MSYFSPDQKQAFKKANMVGSLDNGSYVGLLADATVKMTRGGGIRLNLFYEVISPEQFAGNRYVHSIPMDKPQLYSMLKSILYRFGVDTKNVDLEEVESRMLERIGMEVQFKLFQNGDYQNCEVLTALHPAGGGGNRPSLLKEEDDPFL